MQMHRYKVRYDRIRLIFISHLHGDHVFGLVGLLTSWCLKRRTLPIDIFSPPGMQELVETNLRLCGVRVPITFPIRYHVINASVPALAFENKTVEVSTIPLNHRGVACNGWLFREKRRPRNLIPEKNWWRPTFLSGCSWALCRPGLHCPMVVIPNNELSLPPRPPRAYAFCSDTAPSALVAELVRGVDLLYHEATFTTEQTTKRNCRVIPRQPRRQQLRGMPW